MTKVALITGASAGLGEEFARQLSKRGHRLVLAARRKDRLEALAAELGNARAVGIDLARPGAADRLVADVEAAGETIELLVNNAGFGLLGRFDKADPKRLRQMVDLNCGALTDLCRAALPGMVNRRSGAILNVASTAAFQPGPGMAVYFATKAYVLSLTEALHEEAGRFGVKVSALCPGPTRTEFGEVAGFGGNGLFDLGFRKSAFRPDQKPSKEELLAAGRMLYNFGIEAEQINPDELLKNPKIYDFLNNPQLLGVGYWTGASRNIRSVTRERRGEQRFVRVRFTVPYSDSSYVVSVTPDYQAQAGADGYQPISAHVLRRRAEYVDLLFLRSSTQVNNLAFSIAIHGELVQQ